MSVCLWFELCGTQRLIVWPRLIPLFNWCLCIELGQCCMKRQQNYWKNVSGNTSALEKINGSQIVLWKLEIICIIVWEEFAGGPSSMCCMKRQQNYWKNVSGKYQCSRENKRKLDSHMKIRNNLHYCVGGICWRTFQHFSEACKTLQLPSMENPSLFVVMQNIFRFVIWQ